MKRLLLITVATTAITGCGSNGSETMSAAESQTFPSMAEVVEACTPHGQSKPGYWIKTSANGKSATIRSNYSDGPGIECMLRETDAPASLTEKIAGIRGIDGKQEDEWDGWEAFWFVDYGTVEVTFSEADR